VETLATDLRNRTGRSILHELSDTELALLIGLHHGQAARQGSRYRKGSVDTLDRAKM
jgi:hypothetical protein